jgi:hypothetical protein
MSLRHHPDVLTGASVLQRAKQFPKSQFLLFGRRLLRAIALAKTFSAGF